MKRKTKYLLIPLLSFLCLTKVSAACTQAEIDAFKEIEDEYTVTYEFDKTSKTYTIYFSKPSEYKYLINTDVSIKNLKLKEIDDTHYAYENALPGVYKISVVYSVNGSCNDVLKEITLNMPKYNKYSEDPLCVGNEEFVLCQPTYDKEIDYDTFVSRMNTYISTKKEKEIEEQEKQNENNDEKIDILNIIKENLTTIIIIGVFTILVIITVIISYKSFKKRRRLE